MEGEAGIREGDLVGLYTRCVWVSLDTGQVGGLHILDKPYVLPSF